MDEPVKTLKPLSEIPEAVLHGLVLRWMASFESAARSENRPGVMGLFSKTSLICGAQKDGPMDRVLSKSFTFNKNDSNMMANPPHILVCCSWDSPSDVVGGPTYKGDATFYLSVQASAPDAEGKIHQRFVCLHAHFSQH